MGPNSDLRVTAPTNSLLSIDIYRFPEDFISATATAATDEYFHAVRISDVDFVNITMPSSALADLDVVSS